ncbi:MAG: transposase [Myxococcota bacterium]
MARKRRIDFPGAWHHVMHRGARKEAIFEDDADCVDFLDLVGDTVERFGLEVHAYALMPNHYHMLVRSVRGNLSRCMRHLNGVYTQRLNWRHGWDGALFRGRYHSQLVDSERHLHYLVAYLHLNPVRAHLVTRPDEECWTSHRALVGLDPPPPWLIVDTVRRLFGSGEALHEFVRAVHLGSEPWPEDLELDQGWIRSEEDEGALPEPPDVRVPATLEPEALLERVADVTGSSVEELRETRRGRGANPARRFAVVALSRHPDLRHGDIGSLLDMPKRQVSNVLYRHRSGHSPEAFEDWMARWEALGGVGAGPKSEK